MSESQAYTVLIPPDIAIEKVIRESGTTLENFALSPNGKNFVENHILSQDVDISVSDTYTNLLNKQVRITLNNFPCRTAFNGISVEICGDEPENTITNGSIYFLSDVLPF